MHMRCQDAAQNSTHFRGYPITVRVSLDRTLWTVATPSAESNALEALCDAPAEFVYLAGTAHDGRRRRRRGLRRGRPAASGPAHSFRAPGQPLTDRRASNSSRTL